MSVRVLKKALLPAVLLGTTLLGGCYYTPYPGYYPAYASTYPAYGPAYVAPAPVVGPVVIGFGGGYYGRRYWR